MVEAKVIAVVSIQLRGVGGVLGDLLWQAVRFFSRV
jgi:hypothetical protein